MTCARARCTDGASSSGAAIEALEAEAEKPDAKRNWKAVLDSGQRVLDLAGKAADLGTKLAPYTPAVFTLMDQAKHYIK